MMMDLTIQCLVGCKQQMRSDTPLGGEGGRREMRVGDGPPAHLLGGHASSGEGSWVWGGRSGSLSSSCSRKYLHRYKMERKGAVCVYTCSQVGGPPNPISFPPFHLNPIVFTSSLLLAASLWITSSFCYCSWKLFGRIVWEGRVQGCEAEPPGQAKLTFCKALFSVLLSPGDSLSKGY